MHPATRIHRSRGGPARKAFRLLRAAAMICLRAAPAPAPADTLTPMTIDEVAALLEAGIGEPVVLRQVKATRTRLVLTVGALLRLKEAGASDAFIEALMPADPDAPEAAPRESDRPDPAEKSAARPGPEDVLTRGESSIRLFVMEDETGDRIVHITNLDENGRRIGGEIPDDSRAERNVIAQGSPGAALPPPPDPLPAPAPQTPVVVNVYPPEPPERDSGFDAHHDDPFGAFIPTGVYPGFFNLPYGRYPHVALPHGQLVGPRWGLGGVVYSPPGSYSHYIRYHRPAGSHRFRRYTGYTIHDTRFNAAERNRQSFGHR